MTDDFEVHLARVADEIGRSAAGVRREVEIAAVVQGRTRVECLDRLLRNHRETQRVRLNKSGSNQ